MKKIAIIGGGLAPYFNEAMANQIRLLAEEINANVITCNDLKWMPLKIMKRYLIINTKFVMNKTPLLSLINGAIFYFIIKVCELKHDIIYVPGGFDSDFLNYLNLKKCVLIVTSIPFINENTIKRVETFSPKVKGIIVQSKRAESQLVKMGVDKNKISFLFPLLDFEKFKYSHPPPMDEFNLLFASAPNLEIIGEDNFEDKGVTLLLETYKDFIRLESEDGENSNLLILWRGKYTTRLYQKIHELGIEKNVEIINDIVHMPAVFSKTHVTVIPYLNLFRSPEIPLSALESLSCGRPVVSTNVAEISEIISLCKCGCVAQPQKKDLLNALVNCKENYMYYHENCKQISRIILDKSQLNYTD